MVVAKGRSSCTVYLVMTTLPKDGDTGATMLARAVNWRRFFAALGVYVDSTGRRSRSQEITWPAQPISASKYREHLHEACSISHQETHSLAYHAEYHVMIVNKSYSLSTCSII